MAILVDAFVVRLALLPTIMNLLGERAQNMPAWPAQILPRVNVERPDAAVSDQFPTGAAGQASAAD